MSTLPSLLSFQYPANGSEVFAGFGKQGVPPEVLLKMLAIVARDTAGGTPLHTVVGSPIRGVAGGARKQHLAVWALDFMVNHDQVRRR